MDENRINLSNRFADANPDICHECGRAGILADNRKPKSRQTRILLLEKTDWIGNRYALFGTHGESGRASQYVTWLILDGHSGQWADGLNTYSGHYFQSNESGLSDAIADLAKRAGY